MKLLLDTHLLLWAAQDRARVPRSAAKLMADPANELLFSVLSIWEIEIKHGFPRHDFAIDVREFHRELRSNSYVELPLTGEHVIAVSSLPRLHRDPFDRLLVAQAIVE